MFRRSPRSYRRFHGRCATTRSRPRNPRRLHGHRAPPRRYHRTTTHSRPRNPIRIHRTQNIQYLTHHQRLRLQRSFSFRDVPRTHPTAHGHRHTSLTAIDTDTSRHVPPHPPPNHSSRNGCGSPRRPHPNTTTSRTQKYTTQSINYCRSHLSPRRNP